MVARSSFCFRICRGDRRRIVWSSLLRKLRPFAPNPERRRLGIDEHFPFHQGSLTSRIIFRIHQLDSSRLWHDDDHVLRPLHRYPVDFP